MSTLDESIKQLLAIEGATGAAVVDYSSGMALAQGGNPGFDLGVAAAGGNSNVVSAKLRTMAELSVDSDIEDILITLGTQYHLINVLNSSGSRGPLRLPRTRSHVREPGTGQAQAQKPCQGHHHLISGGRRRGGRWRTRHRPLSLSYTSDRSFAEGRNSVNFSHGVRRRHRIQTSHPACGVPKHPHWCWHWPR